MSMGDFTFEQLAEDMVLELVCDNPDCGAIHHVPTAEVRAEMTSPLFQCGLCRLIFFAGLGSDHYVPHDGHVHRVCVGCAPCLG